MENNYFGIINGLINISLLFWYQIVGTCHMSVSCLMVDILERENKNFKGKEDEEVLVSVGINPMV